MSIDSDVCDIDNVYLSDRGWAYRFYTNPDKTEYYDVVLVAGQVPGADNPDPFLDPTPQFEFGDGEQAPHNS